jgi:GT2 family glycosyltransferase
MISKMLIEILKLQSYVKRLGIKGLYQRVKFICGQSDVQSENTYTVWQKKHQRQWRSEICCGIQLIGDRYVMVCGRNIRLAEDAIEKFEKVIAKYPNVDMIYCDHEVYQEKHVWQPCFKPDYSRAYLRSVNYIGCMVIVRKQLLEMIQKESENILKSDMYELLLRISEKTDHIEHIPDILYQCEQRQEKPHKQLIEEHLKRLNVSAKVTALTDSEVCHVQYDVDGNPLISVIIPNKDHSADLERCIASLQAQSYQHLEIIVVENNSCEQATFDCYQKLQKSDTRVRIIEWSKAFNYSAINNMAVREAKGEYVLLLNNDVAMTDQQMIEKMLGQIQQPQVGIVGAKLLYADGGIQHAGVIVGYEGVALHWFQGQKPVEHSYMNRSEITQDLSAVTAACMLVSKDVYIQVGGMDEQLAVAYNDIDFCLSVKKAGYHIIYDADAVGLHDESKSRGTEDTVEKMQRFNREVNRFYKKWKVYFKSGDPYYNPNLSLSRWDSKYKI